MICVACVINKRIVCGEKIEDRTQLTVLERT